MVDRAESISGPLSSPRMPTGQWRQHASYCSCRMQVEPNKLYANCVNVPACFCACLLACMHVWMHAQNVCKQDRGRNHERKKKQSSVFMFVSVECLCQRFLVVTGASPNGPLGC